LGTSANKLIEFDKMGKKDSFLDKLQGAHDSRFESKKGSRLFPFNRVRAPDFKM
jgi:hypothetical protein